jgi:outer membrane biosynthesis protein TonB
MDRAEATGLGVALAGHAALVLALALGMAVTQRPRQDDAMEVSFLEEIGPVTSSPQASEAPAPSLGQELAPAAEPGGAAASVPEPIPEPVTAPIPEPVRPPVETGERRRPDLTRNAVPLRPVVPRVAQVQPRPQPQRTQQQPQRTQPQPQRQAQPQQSRQQQAGGGPQRQRLNVAELARSLGGGSPQGREGSPGGTGTARQVPAALSGAQRQAISRQIGTLIAPCADRIVPPNGFARSISVILRVTVTPQGVPTSHSLVSSAGTTPENREYVDDVVAGAMRAVRACASRIATLPAEHYQDGWRNFRYEFEF